MIKIAEDKTQLLYKYNAPIIWNISVFGNEYFMILLKNIIAALAKYNVENPFTTVHGSYSCKYNGGRDAIFFANKNNIENKIREFNKNGIGVKLTFSNMNIHKDTFEEPEMRWYLDILNDNLNVKNGIICVNDDFAEIVKKNYPKLELVASHVKMEMETQMGKTDTPDYYNSKFDLYDIVVFNSYRAFDDEFLSKITHPEQVEFIVNHSCTTNCEMSKYHHGLIDKLQAKKIECHNDQNLFNKDPEAIKIRDEISKLLDKCLKIKQQNIYDKMCVQFLNRNEINHLIDTFGINKFKIEGRDLSDYEFLSNLYKYILNNQSIYNVIFDEHPESLIDDIKMLKYKQIL